MARLTWVLVIILWFEKCNATRVQQQEEHAENRFLPEVEQRALKFVLQRAADELGTVVQSHWPTVWPYLRGLLIREIKKPLYSAEADIKAKVSREAYLMPAQGLLKEGHFQEEVRKAKELARLWHPGMRLETEEDTGVLRHFRRLAGSLSSAHYLLRPAGAGTTLSTVRHFRAPVAAWVGGLQKAARRLQDNLTCSEQQVEKFLQSFYPMGGIFEGPRLYSKHATSNLTTIFLAFGLMNDQLTDVLCHRLMREQENYNVLWLSVNTFEQATRVLHSVTSMLREGVKDVTLTWFAAPSSFALDEGPTGKILKDFLNALQPLLSESPRSPRPALLLDSITVLPTMAEVAQHFSRQLPGVPVYAVKDRLCQGNVLQEEDDDDIIHCHAASWNGFPAVFLSEVTNSNSTPQPERSESTESAEMVGEIFEFYDGVTFPGDEALCELWCSMIQECGSLTFTQTTWMSVGICVLQSRDTVGTVP